MEMQAIEAAKALSEQFMLRAGGEVADQRMLVNGAIAGYLAASGVPTDQAVQAVTRMMAGGLVSQAAMNPLFYGVPWMVPGPVSGAPYYSDR